MKESTDKKSYYAVIPADVRYDASLPPNAKLLYGEITALCSEKGYCWASNSYFAKLYGKDIRTISRWIALLIKAKYIKAVIDKRKGNKRRLYLWTKMSIALDKNVLHNTTDNTTTKKKDKDFPSKRLSKADAQDQAYRLLTQPRLGVKPKVAHSIVYEQHVPLESIEETIKNGLAREKYEEGFVLQPGYIVAALNGARREGKVIGPTKKSRLFKEHLDQLNKAKNRTPLTQKEFAEKKKNQITALQATS